VPALRRDGRLHRQARTGGFVIADLGWALLVPSLLALLAPAHEQLNHSVAGKTITDASDVVILECSCGQRIASIVDLETKARVKAGLRFVPTEARQ
jgi:hypothetical protein